MTGTAGTADQKSLHHPQHAPEEADRRPTESGSYARPVRQKLRPVTCRNRDGPRLGRALVAPSSRPASFLQDRGPQAAIPGSWADDVPPK